MKAWKKLAFLLSLTFSFSTVATSCDVITNTVSDLLGGDSTESSVDLGPESGDTNPDGGDTNPDGGDTNPDGGNTNPDPTPTPTPDDGKTAAALETLADKVVSGVEGVQSLKVSFDFDFLADGDETVGNGDESGSIYGTALFTGSDNGLDMQLNLTMESAEDKEEEVLYYYDNYLYMYGHDEEGNKVLERAPESLKDLIDHAIHASTEGEYDLAVIGAMVDEFVMAFAEVEFPAITITDIWNATYVEGLVTESTVTDEAISISIDRAAIVDDLISTFDGLTMNSSLMDTVNCVLAKVDSELTASAILMEIAKLGPVSMSDVNDALPTIIGMSAQELLDALMADETVNALIVENFGPETAEMLENFDVEVFLATPVEDGATKTYGDITFNELVGLATEGQFASVMALTGAVESMLTTTKLSDIDSDNSINMILQVVQALDCKKMETKLDASFDKAGALTEFTWKETYTIAVEKQGTVYLTAEIKVHEISTEYAPIVIPEGWEQEYWECGCAYGYDHCTVEGANVKYNKEIYEYLCPDCAVHYICPECNELVTGYSYYLDGDGIYHEECYYIKMEK